MIERSDEEAEGGEECRICWIAVRRSIAYWIDFSNERQMVCLLTKQSHMLENQSSPSFEAIANNHVSTSHYMSSMKKKNGMRKNQTMNHREILNGLKPCNWNAHEIILKTRVSSGLDVKTIKLRISHLQKCNPNHPMITNNIIKENAKSWVLIPQTVDTIDYNL